MAVGYVVPVDADMAYLWAQAMGFVVTVASSKPGRSIELTSPEFLSAQEHFILRKVRKRVWGERKRREREGGRGRGRGRGREGGRAGGREKHRAHLPRVPLVPGALHPPHGEEERFWG
eukprot:1127148-Rhodomonas_salina.2